MPKTPTNKRANTPGPRGGALVVAENAPADGPAYIVENGRPTHVLVPVDEYERLVWANAVDSAIGKLKDDEASWVDAGVLGMQLAGERIARARKTKGLTQKQLGERLGLPQSQISRIERNPDRAMLRTLKRIARVLGVDVRALI